MFQLAWKPIHGPWSFSNQPPNSLRRINRKLFRSPFLSLARYFFIYMNCSFGKLAGTQSRLESIPMKSFVGLLIQIFPANYEEEISTPLSTASSINTPRSFSTMCSQILTVPLVSNLADMHLHILPQFSSDLMSISFLLSLCEWPIGPKSKTRLKLDLQWELNFVGTKMDLQLFHVN